MDLNAAAAGHVLGYNHYRLTTKRENELYDRFVTHKLDVSTMSEHDMAEIIRGEVMEAAPRGLFSVHLSGSTATHANESALQAALEFYAAQHNVDVASLSVLGFDTSHHGSSKATLSCSNDDSNSGEADTFSWPRAEFPRWKYPFAEYEHENMAEEARCLDGVKDLVERQRANGTQVGAIIVEPITTYGNHMATPLFFKRLREFAKKEGIQFIVDETNTGMGSTGKKWGHDHWYLHDDQCPDYVTFGGKSGIAGFYSTLEHRLNDEATSFEKSLDMAKLLAYGEIWRIIEHKNLFHWQRDTSSFLKIELERVGNETGLVKNLRGYGTHLGFDCPSSGSLQRWLYKTGFNLHKCGPNTFGLRPSLTLNPKEGAEFRKSLFHYHPNFE